MKDNNKVIIGYSLKKHSLKKWIYSNGYTQPYIAKRMGMKSGKFKRMLRRKEKFNREQIKRLIYFMKAENAFNVIYFPSLSRRRQIRINVFGDKEEKRNE